MATLPAYDLDAVRAAFPISQSLVYLNHASISPIPEPAREAMHIATDRLAADPFTLFVGPPDDPVGNVIVDYSAVVADLIHAAAPHEVIGVMSTSSGINAVAQAIAWQPGDNLVFAEVEFPSNAYPWMVLERRGVEVRQAPAPEGGLTLEALDALVDGHTRLVAVSAVQFLSGFRADLAALGAYCRERGILFLVDAIQSAGHMLFDVQALHIDVLVAGGQKSLMGPPGQGFLYVREAVAETMQPGIVGPNSVEGWEHWLHYDLTPLRGARRFNMGTINLVGMAGGMAAIRFLRDLGIENIDAWTQHLSRVAMADLAARGYHVITPDAPGRYGPIVSFRAPEVGDLEAAETQVNAWMQQLNEAKVRLTKHWDAAGVPHLRISTHCYNTEDEVRRVGEVLGDYHS